MDKDSIWNWVMLIGLIAIFVAGGLAYYEFRGAERYCVSIDGNYKLDFFPIPPTHFCNNKPLIQYSDGWDFERIETDNKIIIELP